MEALVMTASEFCRDEFGNVHQVGLPKTFDTQPMLEAEPAKPSQLDRIESRLGAIAELLAVLLDSVKQEDEQEPSIDLDGEVIERVKHEQDWL
jgi:hypothetical protein